jgi:integrase
MSQLNNVVHLNPSEDKNPYATILTFLTRAGQDSKNTESTYYIAIRDFFRTMRGKELQDLVEEDLIFTPQQIENYQVALKEQCVGKTVNTKMTAIGECYKKLERNGFAVDADWFDVDRYDEHDSKSYDALTHDEINEIIQLVSKTREGAQKALLVRLAFATAWRRQSLEDLEWSAIINRNGEWFIKTMGKGNKWSYKKLTNELYEALMEHKKTRTGKNPHKIFGLSDTTIKRMMKFINKNMDFGDRRIVFHSIKKASIDEVDVITGGNIKAMQQHGDHASAQTTMDYYASKKKLDDLVAVDVNMHVPVEKFDELTHEELLTLVKSADRNLQIKLLQNLGVM